MKKAGNKLEVRVRAIGQLRSAATHADCAELVATAAAARDAPTVLLEVCAALSSIAYWGGTAAVQKLVAVNAVQLLLATLSSAPVRSALHAEACEALYYCVVMCPYLALDDASGSPLAAYIRSQSGPIEELRQASRMALVSQRVDFAGQLLDLLGVRA